MKFDRLTLTLLSTIGLSFLFALLHSSFALDFSLIAFPLCALYTAALVYCAYALIKKSDVRTFSLLRKLLQYFPFVLLAAFIIRRAGLNATSYAYDVICVVLWTISSIDSLYVLYLLNPKRFSKSHPTLFSDYESLSKPNRSFFQKVFFEVLDWVDAFVQAAFTVALINIFVLQLYALPTESMVPEFLVGDRVISLKTTSGPEFPLSEVSLPQIKNFERGDIVIFQNPHYNDERSDQIKTFVSQLVYMLTFTLVNTNVDENGNLKADPLVKRVVGEPGEQLVMVDGILYARTAASNSFTVVTDDALWAHWNLNTLPQDLLTSIQDIPLSQNDFDMMVEVETLRKQLDFSDVIDEATDLAQRFSRIKAQIRSETPLTEKEKELFFTPREMWAYSLFAGSTNLTKSLLSLNGGSQWFTSFMTDWSTDIPLTLDFYADSMYRLNLLIKLTIGRLVVRNAELIVSSSTVSPTNDNQLIEYFTLAQKLNEYVILTDRRNMPVFPQQTKDGYPQYLEAGEYFVMGDNRFNSLDLRHSYDSKLIPLTQYDAYAVQYYSNIEPQSLKCKNILGTTLLRFWPIHRFGVPTYTPAK